MTERSRYMKLWINLFQSCMYIRPAYLTISLSQDFLCPLFLHQYVVSIYLFLVGGRGLCAVLCMSTL